jgi:hypothetical protein
LVLYNTWYIYNNALGKKMTPQENAQKNATSCRDELEQTLPAIAHMSQKDREILEHILIVHMCQTAMDALTKVQEEIRACLK